VLVPAGDVEALADAVRSWLVDAGLRRRLREAAAGRRTGLARWEETVARVACVLDGVAA
jgi:glycosyltransferase involved in cell wall biosynthesis